jgi:Leucine-rich repeat (LRR) protein
LKNLKELHLIGNQVKTLPEKLFEDLTSLESLRLQENPIENFDGNLFSKLINLKFLNFGNAFFEIIPDGTFKNNRNLEMLTLGGKITKMSNKMFSHLTKLRYLNLLHNHCVSLLIEEHNSSIAFTEEILSRCSCKALTKKPDFHVKAISALKVFTIAAILFVLVLIMMKMMMLQNSRLSESFLVFKNGEFYSAKIESLLTRQSFTDLRETAREYMSNTTIHGLNYIQRKSSFLVTR